MAIVIKDDLGDYLPAYNDMSVVIQQTSSTIRAKTDYQYIFDLFIVGLSLPIRFKVRPEPSSNGYGIKNIHKAIESYVNAYILKDPALLTGGFQYMDGGIVEYHIEYGEEYRATPLAPIIVYANQLTGATKYAWNASYKFNEWVDFDFSDINASAGTGEYLTTLREHDVSINDVGYSGVIGSTSTDMEYIEVLTYDSAGVLLGTYRIQNTLTTGTTASKYLSVITAPVNLNNVSTGLVLGAQPIIDSSVASYTCRILDNLFNFITSKLTFTIKEQCNYPIKRLLFQNKYGAFDAFNFDLVSKESVNIEKKSYKFNPTRINSSGILEYSTADRSNVNYRIKSSNQIELNADYITEAQSIWLEELFTSPEIYLQSDDGLSLTSVSEIQSNTYQIKTTKVDKLFNVNLIITLSNDNYRQRK